MEFLRSILEALWRLPARIFGSRNQRLLKQYSHRRPDQRVRARAGEAVDASS